jgi:putative heme-binding domain-containing protein
MLRHALNCFLFVALVCACVASASAADAPRLELKPGDHVCIIGNTLAERMQYFGHFETLLHSRFPTHELVVRDLGWSADELMLRPRSQDFQDHGHRLEDHQTDVVIACFGFNESFAGPAGLAQFEADLEKFISETLAARYNGRSAPRLALVSPIAHENLGNSHLPDGKATNQNLELYTAAMANAADKHALPFVDLFHPTLKLMAKSAQKLTINGIHLNDYGDAQVASLLDAGLFGPRPAAAARVNLDQLRAEVNEKNLQFFYDYRAVNGFYIYGGRKRPFGVVNFPAEFVKLRKMIDNRDHRIWAVAQGKSVPAKIDDSNTGDFTKIETNMKNAVTLSSPEESRQKMELAEGYEVNLFASEQEFPDLQKPVQCAFDARGRLWVCTMSSYPMYLPGTPVDDKILILEDTNGDGKADKQIVFADKLHLPTGIELGDGGAYVAAQPNLVFLKDTDGDDRADVREFVLHGFDSADSHHSISAFTYDPGGALYFEEGTFHHTQVETPYGPRRCKNAGVYRWEPRTDRFDVFVSYSFANPWGHTFDRWGQDYVADASGGANYFAAAFSGDVDYPNKHGSLKQFLVKQWRPTSGCELVSSRNFPDEAQGNYLLNNCIGFQGVLQYKMRDDGSGVAADPVDPLLRSSDPNFRPVDLEFGPDGALYVVDWYNPLVGHMQHSVRDPYRDHTHGRIWRIRYKNRPLVEPAKIAGQPIPALLDLLKTYEDRTRYRVRTELWNRDSAEVMAELQKWLAGLAKNDPQYDHNVLEGLWLHQAHDVIDEAYLKQVLRSPDYRSRAAATRVLCYWRDRVGDPLALLQQQVGDEHPRVRLEAVRALSFFHESRAIELAVESLLKATDDYLMYTLHETLKTLEHRVKGSAPGSRSPAASSLTALLEHSKLPPERVAPVVELLCQYGNANDLAYVLEKPMQSPAYSPKLRVQVLNALADAAVTRKVRPSGDLKALEQLVNSELAAKDPEFRNAAMKLASIWKVASVANGFRNILNDKRADTAAKEAAMDGLAALGDKASREMIGELTTRDAPSMEVRLLAVAAFAKFDLNQAAGRASAALSEAGGKDDPAPLLDAFLNRKGGADKLAAALEKKTIPADVAKLSLRYMYSVGRSDAKLSDALSKAAGIAADPPPPTQDEVKKLAAEVAAKGDPARGEQVFRRSDLSCLKCHSVSRAGGTVGPDLSAVGATSPAEYVVNSILLPDLAIKEQFVTRVIVTADGQVLTGIVVSRDDVRVTLKDAAGKLITIPTADIEEEAEGKSLMPKGLTKFLTHSEFIDLARFISELGKPGPYAIRSTPTMQRWRVLKPTPAEVASQSPNLGAFRKLVLGAKPEVWQPAYAKVAGVLPLGELAGEARPAVLVLQGEIEVVEAGKIGLNIESTQTANVWVDDRPYETERKFVTDLPRGRHKITLRVVVSSEASPELKLEFFKPAGSTAQFEVVGGT